MGIYISGMELPKDAYIDVRLFADGWAHIPTDEPPYYNKAFEAVELPPHGRLIDADDIENITVIMNENGSGFNRIVAPTIIPADPEGGADG